MQVPSTKSLELDEIQIDKSFLYIKNKEVQVFNFGEFQHLLESIRRLAI